MPPHTRVDPDVILIQSKRASNGEQSGTNIALLGIPVRVKSWDFADIVMVDLKMVNMFFANSRLYVESWGLIESVRTHNASISLRCRSSAKNIFIKQYRAPSEAFPEESIRLAQELAKTIGVEVVASSKHV